MKYLVNFLRIAIGCFYIFSGFVKAVDPLGTSYKMHDYFSAFAGLGMNNFWMAMNDYSTPIAVLMLVVELVAGFCLLIGWMPRFTTWIIFLMTLFFTLLTGFTYLSGYCPNATFAAFALGITLVTMLAAWFYDSKMGKMLTIAALVGAFIFALLCIFSNTLLTCAFTESKMKVTDCGCFGDFMKLKPWETFWKDVVLDVLIFVLVIGYKHIKPIVSSKILNWASIATTVGCVIFCLSNFMWGLPFIDFRPYAIGNDINEQRIAPKPEVRQLIFLYKNTKTGAVGRYSSEQLKDLNFDELEYVDRIDSIIDPGIPAKINNLFINNENGEDVTDTLLHDARYSLWVVALKLEKTNVSAFEKKINPLVKELDKAGIPIYCLTTGDIDIEKFRHDHQCAFPFYTADETPLKTMMRSNPGVILLKNGKVIDMWHHLYIPKFEELQQKYFSK